MGTGESPYGYQRSAGTGAVTGGSAAREKDVTHILLHNAEIALRYRFGIAVVAGPRDGSTQVLRSMARRFMGRSKRRAPGIARATHVRHSSALENGGSGKPLILSRATIKKLFTFIS